MNNSLDIYEIRVFNIIERAIMMAYINMIPPGNGFCSGAFSAEENG